MENTKQCFGCKKEKSLESFSDNSCFVLRSDKGKNRVCVSCDFKRALNQLSIVRPNPNKEDKNRYIIIEFKNKESVLDFYINNYPEQMKSLVINVNKIKKEAI